MEHDSSFETGLRSGVLHGIYSLSGTYLPTYLPYLVFEQLGRFRKNFDPIVSIFPVTHSLARSSRLISSFDALPK